MSAEASMSNQPAGAAEATDTPPAALGPRKPTNAYTREEVAAYFPASYYYGGYYYDDFGYDGPYALGTDGRSHRVCRHFLQGRCTWGEGCRFSHDAGAPISDPQDPYYTGPFSDDEGSPAGENAPIPAPVAPRGGGSGAAAVPHAPVVSNTGAEGEVPPPPMMPPPHPKKYTEGPMMPTTSPDDYAEVIGFQQATLQSRRHAVLAAALKANFQIRQLDATSASGSRRGQVTLTSLTNVPNIVIDVLDESDVKAGLEKASSNPRVLAGGLHYLVGETSLFWSMMTQWHVRGHTGSTVWDQILDAAHRDLPVACMFYRSTVGCSVGKCAYLHTMTPLQPPSTPNTAAPTVTYEAQRDGPSGDSGAPAPTAPDATAEKGNEDQAPVAVAEGW